MTNSADNRLEVVMIGPGLAGQTSNLEWLSKHGGSAPPQGGKLAGYDCRYVELQPTVLLGESVDLAPTFLWSTSSSLYISGKEKAVCRRGDAFVFVVDSQVERVEATLDHFDTLLKSLDVSPSELGSRVGVVQYTKRDTPSALPLSELSARFNPMGWPEFEAHPAKGKGVRKVVTKLLRMLHRKCGS